MSSSSPTTNLTSDATPSNLSPPTINSKTPEEDKPSSSTATSPPPSPTPVDSSPTAPIPTDVPPSESIKPTEPPLVPPAATAIPPVEQPAPPSAPATVEPSTPNPTIIIAPIKPKQDTRLHTVDLSDIPVAVLQDTKTPNNLARPQAAAAAAVGIPGFNLEDVAGWDGLSHSLAVSIKLSSLSPLAKFDSRELTQANLKSEPTDTITAIPSIHETGLQLLCRGEDIESGKKFYAAGKPARCVIDNNTLYADVGGMLSFHCDVLMLMELFNDRAIYCCYYNRWKR